MLEASTESPKLPLCRCDRVCGCLGWNEVACCLPLCNSMCVCVCVCVCHCPTNSSTGRSAAAVECRPGAARASHHIQYKPSHLMSLLYICPCLWSSGSIIHKYLDLHFSPFTKIFTLHHFASNCFNRGKVGQWPCNSTWASAVCYYPGLKPLPSLQKAFQLAFLASSRWQSCR